MHLNPEQRATGKENFQAVIGSEYTRRDFLKQGILTGVVSGAGLGAYYFGYGATVGNPVRVGIIGTGDEGGVLIGALTPDFVQVTAISDFRPFNIHRAFEGDQSSDNAREHRPGLMSKYGWKTRQAAENQVKVYQHDYHELLNDPQIEGVIIALPLHLHAKVAIEAMRAGKHVLTEKLMAHSVTECKEMAREARAHKKLLATGHQRHYSILYDHAVYAIRQGLIGQIHHIRAQWHRQNDTWKQPLMAESKKQFDDFTKKLKGATGKRLRDVRAKVWEYEHRLLDKDVVATKYGYRDYTTPGGYNCPALEELIRWRLWDRTGGGLMAELGSHQLDAASIFISAMRSDGKKVHPLSVTGVGGRHLYEEDRDTDDHVYCSFEFPAPEYEKDKNKKVVVTYSSINGNGFGGYGEVVMADKGTLILDKEEEALLFGASTATKVGVTKKNDAATLDTTASGDGAAVAQRAMAGPVSRGYTEEIEHWAWCIREFDESALAADPAGYDRRRLPKCHPQVAMADAVIALTSNIAINQQRHVEFKPGWFDIDDDATPEMDEIPQATREKLAAKGIHVRQPDAQADLKKYPLSSPEEVAG